MKTLQCFIRQNAIRLMLAVAIGLTYVSSVVAANSMTAEDVMTHVFDRDMGRDSVSEVVIESVNRSGKKKQMRFDVWNKSYPNGSKSLMKYKKPNYMRDTGLLMHSDKQSKDLQWLYLSHSSKREPRKIGEGEKGDRMFGTDIYFIDMEEKDVRNYRFSLKGKAEIKGRPSYIIEAIAKDPDYPYSKTISWVDMQRFIELKIDFYQEERLIKTLDVENVELLEDIWTVKVLSVSSNEKGSYTRMTIDKIDYNVGIDERRFSFAALMKSARR